MNFSDVNIGDVVRVDLSKQYGYIGPAKVLNKTRRKNYGDVLLPDFDVKIMLGKCKYIGLYAESIKYKVTL
jgi:hypothetical protein